jgi:glycosyltransferase involved in cell wall biosynthesis
MAEPALRILQVLRAPIGGLFRHVADLTRGLVARGHAVGLVMDAGDAGPRWEGVIAELAALAPLGLTRIAMPRSVGARDASAIRHVHGRIRSQSIEVVHGHGAKGGAYARIAATAARRGVRIYTPHGGSLHFAPNSLEGQLYHRLERMLARATDAVVFESDFARRGFADMLGLAADDWPVIYNGLAPDEFEPVPLAPEASDIVFVGEMRVLKGVDVLIDALVAVPEATALLVGAGPDEAQFRARAAPLGARVRFAPPMPARTAFAHGRSVVVPSRAESLPYLVLEAAAAGRPLIATRVGGIPEIFGELGTHLVPAGDAHLLATAIRANLYDVAAAQTRAQRLRELVCERFNVERMTNAIVALYRSKLNQNGT